jgi:uncharacterized membrane protein YhhN
MILATLFLFQLILFAAGILGPWRDAPELKNNGRLPRPIRMLLSFSLLVAAFVIWQSGAKQPAYAQWVCFGMFASFIGDLIMARLIPLPNRLIGGMIVFGIAHALYITAYVQTIQANGAVLPNAGLLFGLVFYMVVTLDGWMFWIRNPLKGTAVNLGALVYGLWIGVMASNALALAAALGGAFWTTALGGLLFVASDFIIGVTDIRGISLKNANDWVWLTYVAGQIGIIYAAWI